MSFCRHSRELTEHFRYGAADQRSERHLRHLQACETCRVEVGIDRSLVRQLQRALQERVAGASPSASAWDAIRRQAEVRPVSAWMRLVASLAAVARGAGGAVAVSALAMALIVFGVRQPVMPADGGSNVPPQTGNQAGAEDEALSPSSASVPAERLDAPRRPDTATLEVEIRRGQAAKEPTPLANAALDPIGYQAVALGLQPGSDQAPEAVVASLAAPSPPPPQAPNAV